MSSVRAAVEKGVEAMEAAIEFAFNRKESVWREYAPALLGFRVQTGHPAFFGIGEVLQGLGSYWELQESKRKYAAPFTFFETLDARDIRVRAVGEFFEARPYIYDHFTPSMSAFEVRMCLCGEFRGRKEGIHPARFEVSCSVYPHAVGERVTFDLLDGYSSIPLSFAVVSGIHKEKITREVHNVRESEMNW